MESNPKEQPDKEGGVNNKKLLTMAEDCYNEKVPEHVRQFVNKASFIVGYCERYKQASGGEDKQDELWRLTKEQLFDLWDEAHARGAQVMKFQLSYSADEPSNPNKIQYFKDKFGIDL